MTFNERFAEYFSECDEATQVAIFNEYANSNCYEQISHIDEFDDVFSSWTPSDIARQVAYAGFSHDADYFTFDGQGNLEYICDVEDFVDVDELADWYEDHERVLTRVVGSADCYDLYNSEEVESIPMWALPALVNGDFTGLTDEEVEQVEEWLEESGYTEVCPPDEDSPYFSLAPAFGLACEVCDCVCR